MKYVKIIFRILVYLFAIAGLVLIAGFFAVQWHLTDIKGSIPLSDRFFTAPLEQPGASGNGSNTSGNGQNGSASSSASSSLPSPAALCKVAVLEEYAPEDAHNVLLAMGNASSSTTGINQILSVIAQKIPAGSAFADQFNACDSTAAQTVPAFDDADNGNNSNDTSVFAWANTPEWGVLQAAIAKDAPVINEVAQQTGVDPRLIVAQLIGEQLRLYTSSRTLYEAVFAPLKILGSETQFSLGVTGIKEQTAELVEQYANDPSSPYYPGPAAAHLLAFSTSDHDSERVARITNQDNHYYAYLYTALFIKEIESQWHAAGFDISQRPEIISTLYNIGFTGSHPNANPQVGGTIITINGQQYTFGSLGYEFYYSGQLANFFNMV